MSERAAVLLAGIWPADRMALRMSAGSQSMPPKLAERAETHWQHARRRNPRLYDGPLVSLQNFTEHNGTLVLNCAVSRYRDLLLANTLRQEGEHELADYLPRALGISAVLQTADARLVLMHRSEQVGEYPNMIDVLGGHIDPHEHIDAQGATDPFVAIRTELVEETGLPERAFVRSVCLGLVENRLCRKPELVFFVEAAVSFAELQQAAATARDRFEFTGLFAIPASAAGVSEFLQNRAQDCTPSCEGCLRVYGEGAAADRLPVTG